MILLLFHLQASMSVQNVLYVLISSRKYIFKTNRVLDLFHKYELALLYNLNV